MGLIASILHWLSTMFRFCKCLLFGSIHPLAFRYPEMEEVKRIGPRLEDVADLVHHIQSLLPVKEAARTCVLSKSWKHAWYTIPTLRFITPSMFQPEEQKTMHFIGRTVLRYCQNNIPFTSFDLRIKINNQELAFVANKWIRTVATQRCLKELSLTIRNCLSSEFILTNEIFSGVNLHTIIIRVGFYCLDTIGYDTVWLTRNPDVINCVSLKVLKLSCVKISDEVLNSIFSTCTLLEKIHISSCTGLTNIKVRNLRFIQEFILLVSYGEEYKILEVDDVPNLRIFKYDSYIIPRTFNIDSLTRVTELSLVDVKIDDTFFDKIKSKFPFLESLKLGFRAWSLGKFDITSASLKKLTLELSTETDVQVFAPKLIHLSCDSPTIPNLSFKNRTNPGKIQLDGLTLGKPTDNHCLYKMRELLNLSSEFDIGIRFDIFYNGDVLDMDIDDLKRRFQFPATNVHKLLFNSSLHEGWVHPSYLDALFTICHPNYITVIAVLKYYSSLTSELMKRKTLDLKRIEFKNSYTNKWEELTDSGSGNINRYYNLELKLIWCSGHL